MTGCRTSLAIATGARYGAVPARLQWRARATIPSRPSRRRIDHARAIAPRTPSTRSFCPNVRSSGGPLTMDASGATQDGAGRVEVRVAELAVRLEVVALAPLVPRVDEQQPLVTEVHPARVIGRAREPFAIRLG